MRDSRCVMKPASRRGDVDQPLTADCAILLATDYRVAGGGGPSGLAGQDVEHLCRTRPGSRHVVEILPRPPPNFANGLGSGLRDPWRAAAAAVTGMIMRAAGSPWVVTCSSGLMYLTQQSDKAIRLALVAEMGWSIADLSRPGQGASVSGPGRLFASHLRARDDPALVPSVAGSPLNAS